ncbi:unnamed protein product, partial [Hapterophycus canaliculatus]
GFDGGDCCECTCVTPYDDDYFCNQDRFACVDPEAPCVDDDDVTIEMIDACGDVQSVGNGYCDAENNNEICGYDGGDCCECTCVAGDDSYTDCSNNFACIDPDAPCANDDDITVDIPSVCDTVAMGNARCDPENNNAECAYDGGDCCECTCEDRAPDELCGDEGFSCIDPDAACVNDDDVTVDMIDNCLSEGLGDGYCHLENNNEECNYDGGDCCECTCPFEPTEDGGDNSLCGFPRYACVDPSAPCVDDDSVTIDMIELCDVANMGDGYCQNDNNIPECAYDGGDCCECTCVPLIDTTTSSTFEGCKDFACIDPDSPCVDDDDVTLELFEKCGSVVGIGDGYCQDSNNKEECGYDGGDCCWCTCENTWDVDWACPTYAFDCKDPSATCLGVAPPPPEYPEQGSGSFSFYFAPWEEEGNDDMLSYGFAPWEQKGPLPTVDGAVEVGTKTEVIVSATAYDVRPGASGGQVGCGYVGGDGCAPLNSRDGISSEVESRWSCASKIVPEGGPCQIEYTFGEPQDVVDIQVAFWKGSERTRTLEVHLDDTSEHTHESYGESTFNTLGVQATGVSRVMLESADLLPDEWISLIEVLIFVTP